MSSCLGCSCSQPSATIVGEHLLLSTRVAHSRSALREVLHELGVEVAERTPGMFDVTTADAPGLLAALRAQLSSVEADEVRALQFADEDQDDLLSAAFGAPTLLQLAARSSHADLLPMFADELRAFRSVYQPIVSLDGTSSPPVIGYEALLRADGPAGPILPEALFGAAAQAGWLHVLDRVGRTTALRGAAGWLGEALLFINFLPTTIYRPQVCLTTTENAARAAGVRLDQLVFEVAESERVTDLTHLAEVFAYYRERGCKVALDDLGAGYASLNMLVELTPDVVKIDKQIVQRLPDPASLAIIKAVVDITHAYGGQVLAECVETSDQAAAARDLGVDLGQGWHFGRPQERRSHADRVVVRQDGGPDRRDRATHRSATAFDGNDRAVVLDIAPDGFRQHATTGPRGSADIEALLARAVGFASAGITIADATAPDMPLIYVNEAFETMTGFRSAEVLGQNCRFLQGTCTDESVVAGLRAAIHAGLDHVATLRNQRKDGRAWWNELRLTAVRDNHGRVTHYFGVQNDVTARVEAQEQVALLAYQDHLTGLPNRLHLLRTLQERLEQAEGAGGQLAVLFLDLDGFKDVNDRHGHAIGDLALVGAAKRLRGALRAGDLLARHSGDEFVVVLADVPAGSTRRAADRTAGAVLGSLATPLQVANQLVQLGASVGVALFPEHGRTPAQLLHSADRAMYRAKAGTRGRAVLAQPVGTRSAGLPADVVIC